jgi:anti-sigma B factor antagonist
MDGRLDSSWAPTASAALEEAIRSGRSRIELDLSAVSFISSVGIGVLLKSLSRFRAVGGTLVIVEASVPVREMLKISRLEMLLGVAASSTAGAQLPNASTAIGPRTGWTGEISPCIASTASTANTANTPRPQRAQVTFIREGSIRATTSALAVGHLALASDQSSAAGHFGEGLVAGGTIAVAPASAPRPDCLASSDAGSLMVDAPASLRGFFEWDGTHPVTLSMLAAELVRVANGPVAFLAIGECAGAFGAWARTSPDGWPTQPPSMNPNELRAALRFAGDPMHRGESMVAVGFAADAGSLSTLAPDVVATLVNTDGTFLHAHAAVASYRPVPRATVEITAAGQLLAEQPLRTVLHALRNAEGTETAFLRGSLWAVPIGASA